MSVNEKSLVIGEERILAVAGVELNISKHKSWS